MTCALYYYFLYYQQVQFYLSLPLKASNKLCMIRFYFNFLKLKNSLSQIKVLEFIILKDILTSQDSLKIDKCQHYIYKKKNLDWLYFKYKGFNFLIGL